MRIILQFMNILILINVTACHQILPQYKNPITKIPSSWTSHSEYVRLTKTNVSELAWWESFHDQELNNLIKRALEHNNQLHVAEGILKESQANLQKIKWSWLPSINADGLMYRGELLNVSNASRLGELINERWNKKTWPYSGYIGGITPSYTLNFFSKYNQTEKTKWDVASKSQMYRSVRLAIISQTAMSYFNLLAFKKQFDVLQKTIHELEQQKYYMEIQYHKGAVSKIAVANSEEKINYMKAGIPKIKQGMKLSENSLAVLTNQNIGSIKTSYSFDQMNTEKIVPYNLPTQVIKQRPDVISAKYELKKYNAQVAEAISQLLPTVNISVLFDNLGFYLGKFISLTSNIIQGQLSAVMPLIDGSIYGQIKRAKAVEYAAIYNYVGTLGLAIADVDNALSGRKNSQAEFQSIKKALQDSKEQFSLAKIQYQQGAISEMDLLNYQINLNSIYLKEIQYKQQDLLSIVKLYQALAGGSCTETNTKRGDNKPNE